MSRLLALLGRLPGAIASVVTVPASERSPVPAVTRPTPFRINSQPSSGTPPPADPSLAPRRPKDRGL